MDRHVRSTRISGALRAALRVLAGAAVLAVAFRPAPVAAEEAEDLRLALLEAHHRQGTVNLAWSGNHQGNPAPDSIRVEMFRRGDLHGLEFHGPDQPGGNRSLLLSGVTDGNVVMVHLPKVGEQALPGADRMNRGQAKWESARLLLESLGCRNLPKLQAWTTTTEFRWDERSGRLLAELKATNAPDAVDAGWLARSEFVGRHVGREGAMVVLSSTQHRVRFRVEDGAPESVERFDAATGKVVSRIDRVPASRSDSDWVGLIRQRCTPSTSSYRVGWEFVGQSAVCAVVAKGLFKANPGIVAERGGLLRSAIDILSAVLCSAEGLDDQVRRMRPGEDVQRVAAELWEPFWNVMEPSLEEADLDAPAIDVVRVEFWGNLWARVRTLRGG